MTTRPDERAPEVTTGVLAASVVLAVAAAAAAVPAFVIWLFAGELADATVVELARGSVRLVANGAWSEPASAYPGRVEQQMPNATGWWGGAAWLAAIVIAGLAATWRRVEPLTATNRLGRRPYDLRGHRPRSWARPRDVPALIVRRRTPDRFTLGTLDGRLLAADQEAHVAVVAPTRSGKTTRCVIPWLLEHRGPAIVTSTKTDVLASTSAHRARYGKVLVWNPFGRDSAGWTPLELCGDWSSALQQAQWLADAVQDGDSEVARYWRGEAAKLLAPLLHAAALAHAGIDTVVDWLDRQETAEPRRVLRTAESNAASRQLNAVAALDDRNRGTTYMSAGSLLAAYRFPDVAATARGELTPDTLLDGRANTLYLIASERHQRLLAPLVVSILSDVLHFAAERSNAGRPLEPTLRVLIDEAANIAPLRELPGHLSQAAAHGVRFATVWQSVAQMRGRYRDAADSILANSTAKLFMGPVTDETTRRYVSSLLGDELVMAASRTRGPNGEVASVTSAATLRGKASSAALQQLGRDRALAVEGAHPPALVGVRPFWQEWPRPRGTR
ncbi:MAG TPA: type IV secretory system conjugative DNA transfer family protein [Solirubrobacteraceae bacterium]|nr:type IV secretory system conjugative DNA transfer family protein [Solirubrobacteraceae bacterium]